MNENLSFYQIINQEDYCFTLRKASRSITKLYDSHFKSANIRSTQFPVLLTLQDDTGKSMYEISSDLGMDRTTLTRNIRLLIRLDLISTFKLPDKRKTAYALTEKGREAIRMCIPLWKKMHQQILSKFGTKSSEASFLDELNRLTAITKKIRFLF